MLLPASPFHVDDVIAKFTITATAGAGGTISPAGTSSFLERATALDTICRRAKEMGQRIAAGDRAMKRLKKMLIARIIT